jgi:MFS family permease
MAGQEEKRSIQAPIDGTALAEEAGKLESNETLSSGVEQYSIFSDGTRTYLTYLLGGVITISTLTATIYFPLIPMLSEHFFVSIQAINLTATVYAICQAISPGIFASLADMYGRRPVLLALISIYALASLGLGLNKSSYAALMCLRALQSISGSATPPIAYGIVADVAIISARGKMLGPMLATCNGISALGPVIGGAVARRTNGYTWVFFSLLAVALVCFLLVGSTLPETARSVVGNGSKPVHGIRRTWVSVWQDGRNAPAPDLVQTTSRSRTDSVGSSRRTLLNILGSLRIVLYPDAAIILGMVASSYSIYYTFQVAIPVIFKEMYEYNELEIGLVFLPGLAGMTLGGIIAGKLIDRNYVKVAREQNLDINHANRDLHNFPIECARYRNILPIIIVEMALVCGYGWAVQRRAHPAIPITMQFFICACSTLLSHTSSALLVDVFPNTPSTAYASGQIIRCGLSAASAAVIEPLVKAVGRGWYFTIFSVSTCSICTLCVFCSRWKGAMWRQKRLSRSLSV